MLIFWKFVAFCLLPFHLEAQVIDWSDIRGHSSGKSSSTEIHPPQSRLNKLPTALLHTSLLQILQRDLFDERLKKERLTDPRPDGLPPIGNLLAQEYEAALHWKVGGFLQLLPTKKTLFMSQLGPSTYKILIDAISLKLDSWYKRITINSPLTASYVKHYGLQIHAKIRSNLCCFMTSSNIDEELQTRQSRVVYIRLFLKVKWEDKNNQIRVTSVGIIDWTPIILHGSLPLPPYILQGRCPIDQLSIIVKNFWRNKLLDNHLPSDRESQTDLPARPQLNWTSMPNYNKVKLFDSSNGCSQDILFSHRLPLNQFTLYHCVTLPIEIYRLLPEERVAIYCEGRYPVGSHVVYLKIFETKDVDVGYMKAYQWRGCAANDDWTAPITLQPSNGEQLMKKCLQGRMISLY